MPLDLDQLRVSDGSGEAVLANIESDRAVSATTLDVDSVDNWPEKFVIATGTPNASNQITASTVTLMYGHLDSGDVVIDGFAPGYTDIGNTSGQIAVIKPNTFAQDELVRLMRVALNDDGTVKPSDITLAGFVFSGGIWTQDTGLAADMTALIFYINGLRYTADGQTGQAFIQSRDTYVDVGINGVIDYQDVANGATAPDLETDHIRIAKIVTDGTTITSIVQSGHDSIGKSIYQVEKDHVTKYFTDVGANTYKKPQNLRYLIVECQGGGGGGGGVVATGASQFAYGTGATGGVYSKSKVQASALGSSEVVTVGSAGLGVSGADGTSGGSSSFGSHCVATGGARGTEGGPYTNTAGRFAGPANSPITGTGDLIVPGGLGTHCVGDPTGNSNVAIGGNGGPSKFGASGEGAVANSNGGAAQGYGSGGGGAAVSSNQSARPGGNGAQGIVIVHEYF